MGEIKARPFLKWAGGKGQLISQLNNLYPKELQSGKIEKYIEPFVGGGAVFFDIMQNFKIKSAYISDVNKDLIIAYKVIQQKANNLCNYLEEYQNEYDKTLETNRSELFYSIRNEFNNRKIEENSEVISDISLKRTAQLIFLNKTCFNGLFRLNSKGGFNVPFGKYKNPSILNAENILAVTKILENVEIKESSYSACFNEIDENSFVYFDPPYRPISKTASFTTYTGSGFNDKEQIQLADFFRKIDTETKAKIMLSNSDPKNENPDDDFFETAFTGYTIHRVNASRAINSNGAKRGKINEIVVTNYSYI